MWMTNAWGFCLPAAEGELDWQFRMSDLWDKGMTFLKAEKDEGGQVVPSEWR